MGRKERTRFDQSTKERTRKRLKNESAHLFQELGRKISVVRVKLDEVLDDEAAVLSTKRRNRRAVVRMRILRSDDVETKRRTMERAHSSQCPFMTSASLKRRNKEERGEASESEGEGEGKGRSKRLTCRKQVDTVPSRSS